MDSDISDGDLSEEQQLEEKLQPPRDDIFYSSIKLMLPEIKAYAIQQGYAIVGGRGKGPKGAKTKQWLKCDRGGVYKERLDG